jgi:hypothetical protein
MNRLRYKCGLALSLIFFVSCASSKKPIPPAKPSQVKPEQLISSNGVGSVILGETVPDTIFANANPGYDYIGYWDDGYFATDALRIVYFDQVNLITLMSPKHTTHHILVGPAYRTAKGIGVDNSFEELNQQYNDIDLATEALPKYWIYRPDRITKEEHDYGYLGTENQQDHRALECKATTPQLPNIAFYFSSCDSVKTDGIIEAILVSNPNDKDLQHVDPFVSLDSSPPCPTPRTDDPDELTKEGIVQLNVGKMGDYHSHGSVQKALPMLRDAALSGSKDAAGTYVGMVNMYIHQEVIGDPLDRPMDQGAQEALFFTFLYMLRDSSEPEDDCSKVLIDLENPLTEEMFAEDHENDEFGVCGGQYPLNYFTADTMEALRKQAAAWSSCWPDENDTTVD